MVKKITPSREKKQISLYPPAISRIFPQFQTPLWNDAATWRAIVKNQPVATICRDTLISNLVALDWRIEPRKSDLQQELQDEIDYYTHLLSVTYDFTEIVEWIGKDLLDLPFGGALEVGREGDLPEGRVIWIELLDGGTLFPTLNYDYPVGQSLKQDILKTVYFPSHRINRGYMSPRTEIDKRGWGMAPPEKIYLALSLLRRGDIYYANLLMDTPEAGILDLGNISKESAISWLESFRDLMGGIDPFKIPVLYDHESKTEFIPFGRPPTELMFNDVTSKYASFVTAGYGMSLSDIGIQASMSGGETLAGSIRQERRTKRTGFATVKKKFIYFFNRILPASLKFVWIDLDDEQAVAVGRARLSNATAIGQYIDQGLISLGEARRQTIADGTFTISLSEEIPEDAVPLNQGVPERPSLLGRPIAPSEGGEGEVRQSSALEKELSRINSIDSSRLKRLARASILPISVDVQKIVDTLDTTEKSVWDRWHEDMLWKSTNEDVPEITQVSLNNAMSKMTSLLDKETWWKIDTEEVLRDTLIHFKQIRNDYILEQNKLEYEVGEIDDILIKIPDNRKIEGKFKKEAVKLIENIDNQLNDIIKRSVISGVRKSLLFDDLLGSSDIMGDNVGHIRRALDNNLRVFTKTFANELGQIMQNLLENTNDSN